MTTPTVTSSTDSQMHNNIMAAGSRDRPPMLATGRYPQWRSRFLRYINTRPNGEALRKCILSGPYKPTTVLVQAVDDSPAIPEHTTVDTPMSQEMWEAIERLQQGESLNIQDRTMNVAGARENVGSLVVQQSGIQCFNCKEFSHFAKECRKLKRVKDFAYHKEKMLLCKQAEQDVPLQAEQYDWLADTDEEVQNDAGYNVFANDLQHSEQSESVSNTCLVETNDSNVIPDSPDMYEDAIQNDQNDVESDDEHVALANLIANLKLDVNENKKIQKQLKKTEFEKYKAFNDRTVDYDKLERKLNETLSQLALKDIEIKKGLKTKAYEISVVKGKHDELVKQILLTKSHYEGLVKHKTKVITDLKLREEHDTDKMLSMEKQLEFSNKIVYKRSQSIQTIHMMATKVPTYNGRPTFANPRYLKQAQSKIPCLYVFPYDQSTYGNILIPDGEETLALERENALDELQCLHLHKVKECDCLAQKLSSQTESVSKEVQSELLKRFAKVEKHSISLEIALQKRKEHVKNDTVWNEKASNVFRKEREQYVEIHDLKAQLQDKNIAISELKKLIEKGKGKSVDTKFDKPSVVRC
nr:hypothetical protein [Tanacetum cinerariifolium]